MSAIEVIGDKKYELVQMKEQLQGGNGIVKKAKCGNEYYAIKFLKKELLNSNVKKQRFLNEIEFCKKFTHENVVQVLDSEEKDNDLCYVMPWYSKNLKEAIQEEMSITQRFNYILQICEGLKFIHNKGVIHRDIKPENILLDGEKLVISDFGISHFEKYGLTRDSDLLANRTYAAPEQKKKGNSKNVEKSADVYALGCIINELFTKENPAGTCFMKIADYYPWLNKLDDLVEQSMRQNPLERPSIDEVLLEIILLKGESSESTKKILSLLEDAYELEEVHLDQSIDDLLKTASEDILIAKHIFEDINGEDLESFNHNYNCHIHYKIDDELQGRYFNEILGMKCKLKFRYESNSYANGFTCKPLDLNSKRDRAIYDEFYRILKKNVAIDGEVLKLFASCRDYHCEEILASIPEVNGMIVDLLDAPILYIVKKLKQVFVDGLEIENHILINWVATKDDTTSTEIRKLKSDLRNSDEIKVLNEFKDKYNIIYRKRGRKYSVIFCDSENYYEFKEYALNLSKPYFIFEGDVLDLIRIQREYDGIIELNDFNSFDITNVLAKILGLRTDY